MRATSVVWASALVLAVATAQPGGGGNSNSGGQQCNTGCCTLAQTVFNGACKPFVDAFRADADRALGESDQVFKQRVARAPVPTSACCVNARAYTQYNCACDSTLIATSPSKGYTPNQVRVVSRATKFSICSTTSFGGSISGC